MNKSRKLCLGLMTCDSYDISSKVTQKSAPPTRFGQKERERIRDMKNYCNHLTHLQILDVSFVAWPFFSLSITFSSGFRFPVSMTDFYSVVIYEVCVNNLNKNQKYAHNTACTITLNTTTEEHIHIRTRLNEHFCLHHFGRSKTTERRTKV